MTKAKVLLIGSGGVGTIAAYGMEYGRKAEVTAVIRSDYEKVIEKGFKIKSCDYGEIDSYKPSFVVKTVEEATQSGPYDYIVISTKNTPDVVKIEDMISKAVTTENTTIVLIQNGIDIGQPIIERFPGNVVLSGVSMISSTNYGGFIDHESTDSLKVGYFDNGITEKKKQEEICKAFIEIYSNPRNNCEFDENVKYTRWRKLVYNATLNSVCALTNVDTGRLDIFGGVDEIIRVAMKEVIEIAKSDGVNIPEETMELMIRSDDGIYYSPSMLVDVRKGNYIELEIICGNAVRIAKKNNVTAPTLSLIYNLLKIVQMRTMEAKGVIKIPKVRPTP